MKLLNYKCSECGAEVEVWLDDNEHLEEELSCPKCDNTMIPWNFKNNKHRWYYLDK